jgi:hypothetical protein
VLEDECLELKPAGKAQGGAGPAPAALVRVDFEHFFTMLWFCYKIDHVIRQFAKCWMDDVMEKGQACAATDEGCDNGKDGGEEDCRLVGSTNGRGVATSNTGGGKGGGTGEISDSAPSAKGENVAVEETIHKQSVSLGVMAFEQSRDGVPDEPGALNMQALCEKFSKDCDETISCMHKVFMHGYAHVIESIYNHLPVVQFLEESEPPAKKRSGSGKSDADSKHGSRESSSKKARKGGGPAPEAGAGPCTPPKCKGASVKGSKEAAKKRPSSIDEKVVASEASISKKSHKKKRPEIKPQCPDSESDEE